MSYPIYASLSAISAYYYVNYCYSVANYFYCSYNWVACSLSCYVFALIVLLAVSSLLVTSYNSDWDAANFYVTAYRLIFNCYNYLVNYYICSWAYLASYAYCCSWSAYSPCSFLPASTYTYKSCICCAFFCIIWASCAICD